MSDNKPPQYNDIIQYRVYIIIERNFFTKNRIFIHCDNKKINSDYEIICLNKNDAYNIYNYVVSKHGIIKLDIGRTNELFINEEDIIKLMTKLNVEYSTIGKIPKIEKSNKMINLKIQKHTIDKYINKNDYYISVNICEYKYSYCNTIYTYTHDKDIIIEVYDYIFQNYLKYGDENNIISLSKEEYISFMNTIDNAFNYKLR